MLRAHLLPSLPRAAAADEGRRRHRLPHARPAVRLRPVLRAACLRVHRPAARREERTRRRGGEGEDAAWLLHGGLVRRLLPRQQAGRHADVLAARERLQHSLGLLLQLLRAHLHQRGVRHRCVRAGHGVHQHVHLRVAGMQLRRAHRSVQLHRSVPARVDARPACRSARRDVPRGVHSERGPSAEQQQQLGLQRWRACRSTGDGALMVRPCVHVKSWCGRQAIPAAPFLSGMHGKSSVLNEVWTRPLDLKAEGEPGAAA
mmetsp:Transcript_12187/g.25769  ORF Transcript_12187/g.25769 Transcript_12187/m.25769 type:complete len:259 (+) Transcript_12187:546-1322(+)